jgi:hypothetical protein
LLRYREPLVACELTYLLGGRRTEPKFLLEPLQVSEVDVPTIDTVVVVERQPDVHRPEPDVPARGVLTLPPVAEQLPGRLPRPACGLDGLCGQLSLTSCQFADALVQCAARRVRALQTSASTVHLAGYAGFP